MTQTTLEKKDEFLEEMRKLIEVIRMTIKTHQVLQTEITEIRSMVKRIEEKIDAPIYSGDEKVIYNG